MLLLLLLLGLEKLETCRLVYMEDACSRKGLKERRGNQK